MPRDWKPLDWGLALLVCLTPMLVGILLLQLVFQATFQDFLPLWSDELWYWHQAKTFTAVGWDNGYYTAAELTPSADWSRYYAWGPYVVMFYSLFDRLFSLQPQSILYINLVLLTIAIAVSLWVMRPNRRQLILMGLLYALWSPMILYIPTGMLEVLQHTIAILLASIFYILINREPDAPPSKRVLAIGVLLIVAVSLIRVTWAVLLLPLFVLSRADRSWRTLIASTVIAVPIVLMLAQLVLTTAAPFTNNFTLVIWRFQESFAAGLELYQRAIYFNIVRLFDASVPLHLAFRLLFLGLFLFSLWQLWRTIRKPQRGEKSWREQIVLHFYNLGFIALTGIFVYHLHDWFGFRWVAANLFFTVLLLVAFMRWRVSLAVIGALVIMLPLTLQSYTQLHESHIVDAEAHAAYADWRQTLGAVLVYQPEAETGWCNTLLVALPGAYDPLQLLAVEPGIGLSIWQPQIIPNLPFKSAYLLLDDERLAQYPDDIHVETISEFEKGTLYRNLDAACDG